MIEKLSPHELLLKAKQRLNKQDITFIEIGVNDGITNDVANLVLTPNDKGYFIEPIKETFDIMCTNKEAFKNCSFIQKAIVPECLKHVNRMNVLSEDAMNQGASIANFNKHRITNQVIIDTVTVEDFIKTNAIQELDFLFCDAESIDHLIILDFIRFIEPKIMFFETGWWLDNDSKLDTTDGNHVIIPSRSKIKQILNERNYYVIDYWTDEYNKREDIIAIKNNIANMIV